MTAEIGLQILSLFLLYESTTTAWFFLFLLGCAAEIAALLVVFRFIATSHPVRWAAIAAETWLQVIAATLTLAAMVVGTTDSGPGDGMAAAGLLIVGVWVEIFGLVLLAAIVSTAFLQRTRLWRWWWDRFWRD